VSRPLTPRVLQALTQRIPLLLLVATVIAGIFGMHIVNGSHGTHSANAPSVPAGVAVHAHDSSQHLLATLPAETDTCASESCACTQASSANCTPSLKTGSLAAPPPGTTIAVFSAVWGAHDAPPFWTYRPEAPAPGQLSISRT